MAISSGKKKMTYGNKVTEETKISVGDLVLIKDRDWFNDLPLSDDPYHGSSARMLRENRRYLFTESMVQFLGKTLRVRDISVWEDFNTYKLEMPNDPESNRTLMRDLSFTKEMFEEVVYAY